MSASRVRAIRWKKLPKSEMALSRINLITLLSPSPDPYLAAQFALDAEPLRLLAATERENSGRVVTMTTVMAKLLAAAVSRHPEFNSVVLGNDVYQLEDVVITIPYLLPGEKHELTNILIDNPHLKSLAQIHDEFESFRKEERTEEAASHRLKATLLPAIFIKSRLYRLIGETLAFRILFGRGLSSNLVLTNASHRGEGHFIITKSAQHIVRAFTRFFFHGAEKRAVVEDDRVTIKEVIPLSIVFDHRLIDGIHLNQFVTTLERLAKHGFESSDEKLIAPNH